MSIEKNISKPTPELAEQTAPLRIVAERAGGRTLRYFRLGQTFTALRYRNYRLWFIGQLVSLVGTWMQTTAQGYLIFELTRSPAYLGYVGFAAGSLPGSLCFTAASWPIVFPGASC
jgi:hypothetical protein